MKPSLLLVVTTTFAAATGNVFAHESAASGVLHQLQHPEVLAAGVVAVLAVVTLRRWYQRITIT